MAFEGVHPQQHGSRRRKVRARRRSDLPKLSALTFYPRGIAETISTHGRLGLCAWRIHRLRKGLQKDPSVKNDTDRAFAPVIEKEAEDLESFRLNGSSLAPVEKAGRRAGARRQHGAEKVSAA